jgi:hypothetical protein
MHLATALLRQAESLFEQNASAAAALLQEATTLFATAHESLQAFGPAYTDDIQACEDQLDFAKRLQATLLGRAVDAG